MTEGFELEAAIEACYAAFRHCEAPHAPLDACTHCCMDPALEVQMRRLPLREITTQHFYGYNDAAKSAVQPTEELRYLIPRLLELVARGEEVHHSVELYLDRLGRREPGAFSSAEWASIQTLCEKLFAQRLTFYPWARPDQALMSSQFDLLLMFDIGGVDIAPMLAHWLATDTPESTLNYVASSFWNCWYYGSADVSNAFAGDRPDYRARVWAWLDDAGHRAVWAQRILQLELDSVPGFAQWQCGCRFTARELVEQTFDALTA